MFIAVTYIGSTYVPGEIISEDTPKEKLDWLIRAGAIREAAHDPETPVEAELAKDDGLAAQAPDPEPNGQDAEGPEDEIDEEAEAPEIDVMDGVVAAEQEEPKKPAEAAARKTAKTVKGGKAK